MTRHHGNESGETVQARLRLPISRVRVGMEKTRRKAVEVLGILLESAAKQTPEYWVDRNEPNSGNPEK